ncbi:MAG: hypothetical protein ABI412_03245 [Sphingomicrobium sp.]
MNMVLEIFLAAALATPIPTAPPTSVRAEARATVRIVRGARLQWGSNDVPGEARLTNISVRIEDGTSRPARLIEFE